MNEKCQQVTKHKSFYQFINAGHILSKEKKGLQYHFDIYHIAILIVQPPNVYRYPLKNENLWYSYNLKKITQDWYSVSKN